MRAGRPIAFVGPSGVGKDTLMAAVAAARPGPHLVRRTITRPEKAGGEAFEGITEQAFAARVAHGDFALWWTAHGLHYGIPDNLRVNLAAGQDVLMNLSRGVLGDANAAFAGLVVIVLIADRATLAARLVARGREDADAIARRLDRTEGNLPKGLNLHNVRNDGPLDATVAQVLGLLYPERG